MAQACWLRLLTALICNDGICTQETAKPVKLAGPCNTNELLICFWGFMLHLRIGIPCSLKRIEEGPLRPLGASPAIAPPDGPDNPAPGSNRNSLVSAEGTGAGATALQGVGPENLR